MCTAFVRTGVSDGTLSASGNTFTVVIVEHRHLCGRGRDSLVDIATRYRPVRGARFCAPVQTVLQAHPAYYTVGTGSFPGV